MAEDKVKNDATEMVSSESAVNQATIDEAWGLATNHMDTDRVSLQALLDKAGVTSEDFQAVCDEHPEMIQNIGGGPTCECLSMAAGEVKTQYDVVIRNGKKVKQKRTGGCHTGVKNIHTRAQQIARMSKNPDMRQCTTDSLFTKEAKQAECEYRKDKPYQSSNGGCSTAAMLEASGDYIVVGLENKAYGKSLGCRENREMNDLFYGIKPGVTISIDSIEDEKMRKKQGNTKGGKYGHDAVKRRNNEFACDFEQVNINFARYGKEAHVCFPKDAYVPEEYAKMLIEQAQLRQNGLDHSQNTENTQTSEQAQVKTAQSNTAASNTTPSNTATSNTKPSNTATSSTAKFNTTASNTTTTASAPSVSAGDLRAQKGELAEDKKGREGATVAIKGGPVEKNVDLREAKKDLEKTDERTAREALRDGQQNSGATSTRVASTENTAEQSSPPKPKEKVGFHFTPITANDKGLQMQAQVDGKKTEVEEPQNTTAQAQQSTTTQAQQNTTTHGKTPTMTVAQLKAYLDSRRKR